MIILLCASGWLAFILSLSLPLLKRKLNTKKIIATPFNELLSDFREFIRCIDGSISSETEKILKRIEENEIKSLPPKDGRGVMNDYVRSLFFKEYDTEVGASGRIPIASAFEVIHRYGNKYIFTPEQQSEIYVLFKGETNRENRKKLRKYFNEYHYGV